MVSIRPARRDEAHVLAEIGASTFIDTFGHLYREEDLSAFLKKNHSRAAYDDLLADEFCSVWVAEDAEGRAVAYAVAGPCTLPVPDKPENAGELSRLYLAKEAQGAGLGEEMARLALAWLEARFGRIYLSVYAENVRAQRLYERLGFVKIHDYFYMVGEHADPEWIMELKAG